MNYFKLICDGDIIGVAHGGDFRKFQRKHSVILVCSEDEAQYVQFGDSLYRDKWMRPVQDAPFEYKDADVIRIDKSEYDILSEAIRSGEAIEVVVEPDPTTPEPLEVVQEDTSTLEYVVSAKLAEMSACCNAAIVDGADIPLSDGNSYHFSFRFADQINIMMLHDRALRGEEFLPYHADGALFVEYSAEDIKSIYGAMTSTILENTAYFNSLKAYINSLTDIESVSKIQYGTKIPSKYKSKVLKSLAK